MSHTRTILSEPTGETYRRLLAFAEDHSAHFSLVWRRQLAFDDKAAAIEQTLAPFLAREQHTSEWPGTVLLGHSAIVRTYRVSPGCTQILANAGRLYAWLAPSRPEDLAFYTGHDRCWLGSIAHEKDAFVDLEPAALRRFRAAVPELRLSD
jgi:hypothetical protein